jgi:hypothetical protein
MRFSARYRAALPVVVWTGFNAILAVILVLFTSHSKAIELALYWSSVGLLVVLAGVVLVPDRRRGRQSVAGASAVTGAPAVALAGACLFGGLAWVFGTYLAYFAVPPLAFCVGRWRTEWRERRRQLTDSPQGGPSTEGPA